MATYTAITDTEIEPEKPVTTSLMNRLRDNPLAIAEGASGAPRIQTAGIDTGAVTQTRLANGAVGQTQLKTTAGTVSTSSILELLTLPGGSYGFYPQTRTLATAGGKYLAAPLSPIEADGTAAANHGLSTSYTTYIMLGTNVNTIFAQQRYIQSSPPYDHGDGPVHGYVYLLLEADGSVSSTYMAEDPPWYGNTRHSPREQFIRDGKAYGRFVRPAGRIGDLKAGRITLKEFRTLCGTCEAVEEEITAATKLRGMDDLPHPFRPKAGQTVVLIDPMDELAAHLIALMQAGEAVTDLFAEDYLRVDNSALKRKGPPGVPIHAARWRP